MNQSGDETSVNEAAANNDAASTDAANTDAAHMEASFTQSYQSIEAYVKALLAKLGASQALLSAEANLSLSAVFTILLGSMVFFGIIGTTWLLLNVLLGLILFTFMNAIVVVITLLLLNAAGAIALFKYLKNLKALVGFSKSIERLTTE